MGFLTAIITHLDGVAVRRQLSYLSSLSPASRFVVCHGGRRADFEQLDVADAVFVDDPSLRGPNARQSYNGILTAVYESYVRDDSAIELVYFVEFDQLILRADFEQTLTELSERTGAGLLAKEASPRNDTNWGHFVAWRDSEPLNGFIAGISRRDDPSERWGCLGTGTLFRREALAAFCSVAGDAPHAYLEVFIPTVVHHLGFLVADPDRYGDLYGAVRWRPGFSVEEAIAEKRRGRTFVHPFRELQALDAVRDAPGPGGAGG